MLHLAPNMQMYRCQYPILGHGRSVDQYHSYVGLLLDQTQSQSTSVSFYVRAIWLLLHWQLSLDTVELVSASSPSAESIEKNCTGAGAA